MVKADGAAALAPPAARNLARGREIGTVKVIGRVTMWRPNIDRVATKPGESSVTGSPSGVLTTTARSAPCSNGGRSTVRVASRLVGPSGLAAWANRAGGGVTSATPRLVEPGA